MATKGHTLVFWPLASSYPSSSLSWPPQTLLRLPFPPHPLSAHRDRLGASSGACSAAPPRLMDPVCGWAVCFVRSRCGFSCLWHGCAMPWWGRGQGVDQAGGGGHRRGGGSGYVGGGERERAGWLLVAGLRRRDWCWWWLCAGAVGLNWHGWW